MTALIGKIITRAKCQSHHLGGRKHTEEEMPNWKALDRDERDFEFQAV